MPFLQKALYFDDLIVGLRSADKGATVSSEALEIFCEASMELRKCASNSGALRKRFLCDNVATENKAGDSPVIKVLGVLWERQSEQIILSVRESSVSTANKLSKKHTMLQTE